MEKLQTQASKLWQLLFDPNTADTYQKMLALTGVILKETAQLLWLLFCSIFVLGAWVGDTGLTWGRETRTWLDSQGEGEADSGEKAAATGQALLDAGQNGAYFLLDKAYEQLGLEKPERPAKSDNGTNGRKVAAAVPSKAATVTSTKPQTVTAKTAVTAKKASTAADEAEAKAESSAVS
ncbi:MAG: hypothetical protein AAFZ80_11270 [Cyanobacteria bacterium P01_A01_bin.105]